MVNMPPTDAPKTSAGENTPPKKPKLRQITVTKSFRKSIMNKKPRENELSKIPTIVLPPNPNFWEKTTKKPYNELQLILKAQLFHDLDIFCNASRDLMKVTAPKAQSGPKRRDKETAGSSSILASVF